MIDIIAMNKNGVLNIKMHNHKRIILKAGVDPNFATDETRKRPVLLAAEKGQWKVLQTFKQHNYEYGASSSDSVSFKQSTVNFAVWTKDSDETVLHLALKRPLLRLHQVF